MQEATSPIKTEAVTAVFYESVFLGKKYPKIQLLTVSELLAEMPVGPKHKAVVYVLLLFALEHNGVKFATQTLFIQSSASNTMLILDLRSILLIAG